VEKIMTISINNLNNKRVLITGGASGIGKSIAEAFQQNGAKVFVCDISEENISKINQFNPTIVTYRTDISNYHEVKKMFDYLTLKLGGLDVIVNNAGISGPNEVIELIDPEDWEKVFAVNMHGTFYCSQLAIPLLKKNTTASIINISSAAGRLPYAHRSPYSASKSAIIGFTNCLAIELGDFGIRANSILPGIVLGDRWYGNAARRAKREGVTINDIAAISLSRVATGTMVTEKEISDMVLFLSSDSGRNITGQSICIDGYLQALSSPIIDHKKINLKNDLLINSPEF